MSIKKMYFLPNFIFLLLCILPLAANCQSELFQQFAKEEIESLREYLQRLNPSAQELNAEKIVEIVMGELEESDLEEGTFWMKLQGSIKKWLNYLPKAANPIRDSQSAYLCVTVRPFVSSNKTGGENVPLDTVKIIELIFAVQSKENNEILKEIGGWQNEELIRWMEGKAAICKDGPGQQNMRRFFSSLIVDEQQAIMGKKPKFVSENYNERVKNNQ